MLPLRIIDSQFNLLGELDKYESVQMLHSWSDVGELDLIVNKYVQHADKLQQGIMLFPHGRLDQPFIIRHRAIELDEDGRQTENWRIIAPSLKSIAAQRLILPALNRTHESCTGDLETIMHHFVYTQLINPYDPSRIYPNLILGENLHRGPMLTENARFDGLAEKLKELSELHGLGWNIRLDFDLKKFVFEVLEGSDFTQNDDGLPQVVFSTERETIAQLEYTESYLDYKNYAVIAGQGEGVERRIVTIGDAVGADRYEMFVDARDISETDEDSNPIPVATIEANLSKRGNEKLSEYKQEVFMGAQALYNATQRFREHYNIGDIVTVLSNSWGVQMNARITAVKEVVEHLRHSFELVFDNDKPTFVSKLQREIGQFKPELKK